VNISERIDLKNIIQLKEAFDKADEDCSGKLDMNEVIFLQYFINKSVH